jgi:hypothetical protein
MKSSLYCDMTPCSLILYTFILLFHGADRLCGLVVRVSGYRSRGPGSILGGTRLGLERGPLSLVSTIEELLGSKNSRSELENRDYHRRDSSR